MAKLELRDYQTAAVDAIWNGMAEASGGVLAALPTGTGKSLVLAEFIRRALLEFPETRILVLTHSRELVAQDFAEMVGLWPECPCGIYSAGLNRRDLRSRVIFAGIQSIHKRAYELQRIDVVLIDEAQSIPRDSDTMWRRFLNELLQINPYLSVCGLSATLFRLDSGWLHKGDNALFSDVVYEYSILDAINAGYLSPIVSRSGTAQVSTDGVGTRGGEFIAGQLDAAASDPATVEAIADELVAAGHDRKSWILFGCGVHHCEMLMAALVRRGISCEGVFATTPLGERDSIINRFKRGEIRCLTSVSALAVGFNAKCIDLVGMARPTKSAGLYIQIAGRGTRLWPGKENCLFMDWGGNIARHGPIDAPRISSRDKGEPGAMPLKKCPNCGTENPISARECMECGAQFEFTGSKVSTQASGAAILSSQIKPEWLDVTSVAYRRHEKEGKPPSMQVTYQCGMTFHREWVCWEHSGFPRTKAVQWWQKRAPACPVPNTVDEALANRTALAVPQRILVKPDGKWTQIVGVGF
jgi:DNA repair protein RadD